MADYKLSYTASEINDKLGQIGQPVSWNDLTDKPFYTEGNWQELLPTTTLPFTLEEGISAFFTTPTAEMAAMYQSEWDKALVMWDGVEYECEPKQVMDKMKVIGNTEFLLGVGDSGHPFAIFVDSDGSLSGSPTAVVASIEDTMNGVVSSTHSIGVSLAAETIHPINTKFIDKLSWNKISDKPFYDEGIKIITLDYSNLPTVSVDLMGNYIYKVTDDILTEADINGANISLSGTIGGIDANFSQELNVDTAIAAVSFPFGMVYQFNYEINGTTVSVMIGAVTQTGEFEASGMTFNIPETGTYVDYVFSSGEGTINSISLEYGGGLKTLEAKYLDIVNYQADKILLAEQQLTFTGDEADCFYVDIDGISFVEGKTYKAMWDGAEYIYKTYITAQNSVAIGDDANTLLAHNTDGGIRILTFDLSSSHTVAISEVGTCEIKQEYLPDSLYTEIDQRIENYISEALGGEY